MTWNFNWHTIQAVQAGAVGGLLLMGLLIRFTRRRLGNRENLHGSAHWATRTEILATGLLPRWRQPACGVYVGAWRDPKTHWKKYLTHDGPEHVLTFAPTRSGKGVGLVIPTLLTWPHAVLVHDLKGENWKLTAGWRQHELGSRCLKFDPTVNDESSVRFNPLAEVRLGTAYEIKDVQNIATIIVDPDGRGLMDHWARTGHALLTAAILHVLYAEPDKTLRGVAAFLSSPGRTFPNTLTLMQEQAVHPVVVESAQEMLNKTHNERSGVLSTAMAFLALYRDPLVARCTETSDFTIRDLIEADPPISLYLVVPPSDKDRLRPLIRLILNQVARTLTETLPTENNKWLLLLIDEFPALGKLEVFQESLAYFAGYGLKAYLIAQDLTQLHAAYGRDESIVSNCHVRVAATPNRIETAELLSKMAGSTTVHSTARTYTGGRLDPMLMHQIAAEQATERRLLTPDEALRLPADDLLIFVAGQPPIYGKKIKYYRDKEFIRRAQFAAPITVNRCSPTTGEAVATQPPSLSPECGEPEVPEAPDSNGPVSKPADSPNATLPKQDAHTRWRRVKKTDTTTAQPRLP